MYFYGIPLFGVNSDFCNPDPVFKGCSYGSPEEQARCLYIMAVTDRIKVRERPGTAVPASRDRRP